MRWLGGLGEKRGVRGWGGETTHEEKGQGNRRVKINFPFPLLSLVRKQALGEETNFFFPLKQRARWPSSK